MQNYKKLSVLLDGYFDQIKEAFDTSVDIRWIEKESLVGLFIISDEVYQIFCKDYGNNVWSFKFQHYDKMNKIFTHDLTGIKGNSKFTILGTIIKAFEYLIINKTPSVIVYGAGDSSRGRKNLYNTFCNDISKKYGYQKMNKLQNDKQLFINFKNDIDPELLFNKIKNIVDDSFGIN